MNTRGIACQALEHFYLRPYLQIPVSMLMQMWQHAFRDFIKAEEQNEMIYSSNNFICCDNEFKSARAK